MFDSLKKRLFVKETKNNSSAKREETILSEFNKNIHESASDYQARIKNLEKMIGYLCNQLTRQTNLLNTYQDLLLHVATTNEEMLNSIDKLQQVVTSKVIASDKEMVTLNEEKESNDDDEVVYEEEILLEDSEEENGYSKLDPARKLMLN